MDGVRMAEYFPSTYNASIILLPVYFVRCIVTTSVHDTPIEAI